MDFRSAHSQSRFLVIEPASTGIPGAATASLRGELISAGLPDKAILQLSADSDEELFAALGEHPELQPPSPRQLVFIAPADELARLYLLARRHGRVPTLIPDAAADAASPAATVYETWRLLQTMAAPAGDYLRSLRAPSETQLEFTPASDELVDPQQLIRELQEAAAADP
jgi:alpha-beta hydrolase superfamily lysophospholipase